MWKCCVLANRVLENTNTYVLCRPFLTPKFNSHSLLLSGCHPFKSIRTLSTLRICYSPSYYNYFKNVTSF